VDRTGIAIWFYCCPFFIDVGFEGIINGYIYLKFVKYSGILGQIVSAIVLCLGFFGFYLYFWLMSIDSKVEISLCKIIEELFKSKFIFSIMILICFRYIYEKIYKIEYMLYIIVYILILLICLYTQDKLANNLWDYIDYKKLNK